MGRDMYLRISFGELMCMMRAAVKPGRFTPTRIVHKSDIPAKALPLKRMAGPPGGKGAAPDESTDPARTRTEDAR